MLSIGRIGGGGGSPADAGYYTASVAKGREDYYAGDGEAPGVWVGAGAGLLGLGREEVVAEDLAALMAGRDPRSAEELRRVSHPDAVTGFDLTFSAPKSASILYGVGDAEVSDKVRQAHDEATLAALAYMEREACRARRGRGGLERVAGEGFVAGAFRHRTSRAGDPQLHTHVVVGNLTRAADGRWSALDGRVLYQHAKTGGYLYQAELRARLSDYLGVEWGPVVNGLADIEGIPREVIEHFSQRRAEIVEAMEDRYSDSARSAQAAALETRRAKGYSVDAGNLYDEWRARAAEHGLGRSELRALVGRQDSRSDLSRGEAKDLADRLLGAAGLTRHASTFDMRHVRQAFAAGHPSGALIDRIDLLAAALVAEEEVVEIVGDERDGKSPLYSTREMLATERRLITSAVARQDGGVAVAEKEAVGRALADRPSLSSEQAEMVRSLTRSGDGVQVVRAAAGVGKTYALEAARDAWATSGYRVYGATLSARAACELRDLGGIEATTIARLRIDLDHGFGLTDGTVLVIDEAGMVGTRDLAYVADHAETAGAKLVLVGDDRQLPEIDAGGAFRGLAERLGACELHEVRRQRDEADRAALRALRDGRPEEWIQSMKDRERLVIARGVEGQYDRLVSDWWEASRRDAGGEDIVMFAPTRQAVRELNFRAQAYRRQGGQLGGIELTIGTDCAIAESDRILCLQNAERELGVLNGQRGTVIAIDEHSRSMRVQLDDGTDAVLPPSYIEAGNVALGYAMTIHKSQGMTVDQSYVLGSEDLYAEIGYTAFSRHRGICRFYVNAHDADLQQLEIESAAQDEAAREMVRALGRSRAQRLALESLDSGKDTLKRWAASDVGSSGGTSSSHASSEARRAAELQREKQRIHEDAARLAASRAERDALGRTARRTRRELNERIKRQESQLSEARQRCLKQTPGVALEWTTEPNELEQGRRQEGAAHDVSQFHRDDPRDEIDGLDRA